MGYIVLKFHIWVSGARWEHQHSVIKVIFAPTALLLARWKAAADGAGVSGSPFRTQLHDLLSNDLGDSLIFWG